MPVALPYVLISATLFFVWWVLVLLEERRGHRIVLSSARSGLDRLVIWVSEKFDDAAHYIGRHVIQLSWYYSLHALLKTSMRMLAGAYHFLETWLHHNRKRARQIRAERKERRNMLDEIADHKQSVSLSEEEKVRLKEQHLER